MKKVPIVFIFNDGYTFPASICIYSLLVNAKENTFYDIYILYLEGRLSEKSKDEIRRMQSIFINTSFHFVPVKNILGELRTLRHITIDTYTKFLIPNTLAHLDKVIYADVDIIFDADISELIDFEFKESLAVVKIPVGTVISEKYIKKVGLNPETYFNAGFFVMNLSEIRKKEILNKKIIPLINKRINFDSVDQDIFNISFEKDTYFLSSIYNYSADRIFNDVETHLPTDKIAIYHYAGQKPWREIVPFGDIWWGYYRKSIYFDKNIYNLYQKKIIDIQKYIKLGKLFDKYKIFSFVSFFKKLFK